MSTSTRRSLLGGAAVLAVTPGGQAALPDGRKCKADNPDAELIALCVQLDALEHEFAVTDFSAKPDTPADDHAEAERDRIADAQGPIVDAICVRPPQTTAGTVAVAHSLALWDGDLFRNGGPDGGTNERLVAALVRGLIGRAGA